MTNAAARVLEEIRRRQRAAGPSAREVAKALGVSGTAVQRQVDRLRKEGALAPDSGDGIVLARVQPPTCAQPTTRPVEKAEPAVKREPIFRPSGKL